ncbi:hypothetical protein NDU88_007686 [Pleurodeles waltl]|uniref:Uncharacterized protein n=1 Tax=Pleurodeles waltl TaxID=8319 RepID=A0AAV7U3U7_PLEWA|nr:hypothetical protein NDU88_007686 [Pleurodeles waltl]
MGPPSPTPEGFQERTNRRGGREASPWTQSRQQERRLLGSTCLGHVSWAYTAATARHDASEQADASCPRLPVVGATRSDRGRGQAVARETGWISRRGEFKREDGTDRGEERRRAETKEQNAEEERQEEDIPPEGTARRLPGKEPLQLYQLDRHYRNCTATPKENPDT